MLRWRRALRLAGGGLAGALLAAVGVSRRAGANHGPKEGEGRPEFEGGGCSHGHAGPYFDTPEDPWEGDALPCGGGPNDCPHGTFCAAVVNPANQVLCRCISV